MGGLVYLEGSDAFGRSTEAEFSAKNAELPPEERISAYNKNMSETGWLTKDLPSLADRLGTRWLAADYETGDMVVHSAYMIHAATTNDVDDGRMRLVHGHSLPVGARTRSTRAGSSIGRRMIRCRTSSLLW